MKAVIATKYGSPDVLQIQDIDKPVPKDNEVLIRIHAATVNAVDPIARKGEPFLSRLVPPSLTKPKYPILGNELAGEIESVGANVTRFKEGEQVFGNTGLGSGAHAEYKCMPEYAVLAIKPTNTTYEEAASVPSGALTALIYLRDKANLQSGQKALIFGASGSVGTAAVQIAKYLGASVTGVCSTDNLEMVKSLGADEVIDYTKEDFTQKGKVYDVVFDTVGKTSFSRCKGILNKNGIFLTTMPGLALIQMLWTSMVGGKKVMFTASSFKYSAKDLTLIKELVENGEMKPVIDRSYPLDQIADAHRYVETGHKKGNVVITMG